MSATIEQTVEVDVPIATAYNQWTQFEEFPKFNIDGKDNAGVVTFRKIDDGTTRVAVQMDFVPEGLKEKLGGEVPREG